MASPQCQLINSSDVSSPPKSLTHYVVELSVGDKVVADAHVYAPSIEAASECALQLVSVRTVGKQKEHR